MEIQCPFQMIWEKTTATSFSEFLFQRISKYGSNLAMVDTGTGKQWRYSELRVWSEMCAERLREMSVSAHSRVAVITSTTGQALFVHFACSIIGAKTVCINGWNSVDELWQQVDLSESTHCVVENQFLSKVEDVRRKAIMRGGARIKVIKTLDEVLSDAKITVTAPMTRKDTKRREPRGFRIAGFVKPLSTEAGILKRVLGYPYLKDMENSEEETSESTADEAASITNFATNHVQTSLNRNPFLVFFSSGTTGLPKAVEITHKSLIVNMQQLSIPLFNPPTAKDRFLLALCIHHCFGTISAYYALVNGATLITIPKYTPKALIEMISNYKITHVNLSPPMLQTIAYDSYNTEDITSTLRSIVVSGAPLDPNIVKACRDRIQIEDIRSAYGMTELGGLCTLSYYGCDRPNTVVNWETRKLCAPHQPGQLLVSGPQVMPNFYKNPKATAELLDSAGFVKTGDAAYYDESGYIYIMDRIKDIIKYKGTLVCPSEVESVLRSHPGIDDCAVVGRQDHVAGEVPAAFVVKNVAHPLLASAEVRQHVSGKIAQFKELRGGVYFISEIPRNICGKIMRRQLKQYWDRERTTKQETANPQVSSVNKEKPRRSSTADSLKSARNHSKATRPKKPTARS
uniref:AMP-binding domain-containing protein n=1 Tax=Steinernema glaseri TaxID=37863 RepID=A0A1I7ZL45_9BILA